jgi:Cu(I)/Ag(I) efflux system membrane fusion protein
MSRVLIVCAAAASIAVAGTGLFVAGAQRPPAPTVTLIDPSAAEDRRGPIYFQDPDGKPSYSIAPKKTPDGRDYRAVPAGADVSFDDDIASVTPPPTAAAGGSGERRIKYYRNPMGLPDTSPTPKKDSMGMDYIPVYEGDDTDDGSVKVSAGKIQRTGVKSEAAASRVIRTTIRAPGTIQLDERRVSVIAMRAETYLQSVADVTTGTTVKKGQPLMQIYSPAVASAAAEYVTTMTSKTTAGDPSYGRGSRQRLTNLDVPDPVIAEIERTRVVPVTVEWSAPRDGIVLERNAVQGMRAQPGDVLFRVADTSVVWAMIDVAERDLGSLAVGQPVSVRARSFQGREFPGKVSVVYPLVSRETRTARVRVELANPDLALLPDMYVDAEIDTGSPKPVVSVPESSVMDTGSRQAVMVDKGEGRFEPREVKVGRRGGGFVEIRSGLEDGEPVVVSANFLIDAESNLKAALKGFAEGAQQ